MYYLPRLIYRVYNILTAYPQTAYLVHNHKIILLPKSPPAIALFVFASSVKSLVLVLAAVTTVASFGSSESKLK